MTAIPTGTVTFVFTDIEGSTELVKQLGERYGDLLDEHRRIVREGFSAADGIEIDTQGDAFFFAFPRARDAVAAAVAVQRAHAATTWPEGVVVRVRIGLHTGEPVVGKEGYLGLDVIRAARICTVGGGGQILLSETTRALVGSTLPDGVSVFPLGERRLKGIDQPEQVYELAIEGIEEAPAPARPEPPEAPESVAKSREEEIGKQFEDFGARLAASIQEQVLGSLEGSLKGRPGRGKTPASPPADGDTDVEDLAARGASLEETIAARVEAKLRAKGISGDTSS